MQPVVAGGRIYQPLAQGRAAFAALPGSLSAAEQTPVRFPATFRDGLLGPDAATAAPILACCTAKLPQTHLSFVGSGTMSKKNDYVRLDGPGLRLEYSGQPSQNFPGTVHLHSAWCDRRTNLWRGSKGGRRAVPPSVAVRVADQAGFQEARCHAAGRFGRAARSGSKKQQLATSKASV